MKALAIDSAVTKLVIAACNDNHTVTVLYDIGMKQSETLLSAIDYVLEKNGLTSANLDYTIVSAGPGSFTGLRLAFAACKAIEQAHNVPVYGVSTLEVYAFPYRTLPFIIVPVIDAKKDKFYAAVYYGTDVLLSPGDYELNKITDVLSGKGPVFLCGPDASLFASQINQVGSGIKTFKCICEAVPTDSLFKILEQHIADNIPPLKDFDGPFYLRASEAEEKLIS
jgi:tRNA threonylcarbamoyladenosine biosynthesis protein TsaB